MLNSVKEVNFFFFVQSLILIIQTTACVGGVHIWKRVPLSGRVLKVIDGNVALSMSLRVDSSASVSRTRE